MIKKILLYSNDETLLISLKHINKFTEFPQPLQYLHLKILFRINLIAIKNILRFINML